MWDTIYRSREKIKNVLLEESLKEQVVHLFRGLQSTAEMWSSIVMYN